MLSIIQENAKEARTAFFGISDTYAKLLIYLYLFGAMKQS
jgi:hypothetical protein